MKPFKITACIVVEPLYLPPTPHRVSVAEKREISVTQFGYKFAFPPVAAADVAKRELTVSVNNGDPVVREFTGQPILSDEFVFNLNDVGVATLRDVDGSGNKSDPSPSLSFTVTDTFAPPAPGQLGLVEGRQIDSV